MFFATVGILPPTSPAYDAVWSTIMPLAVVLSLLGADLTRAGARRAVKVPLVHAEQLLLVLRAVQLDHRAPAAHRGVAHGLVLVRQNLGQERRHQRQILSGERGRRRAERAHERRAALRVTRVANAGQLVRETRAVGHDRKV